MNEQRPLITTDSHVGVPLSVADELPDRLRAKVPHLEERSDGWYLIRPLPGLADENGQVDHGDAMTQMLAAGIKVDPDDELEQARIAYGNVAVEANPGFSVEQRLLEMERDGVVGEVLIGNNIFSALADPEVDVQWARLCNDWLAQEYRDHLDRFAVGINLPLSDVAASVTELERAVGLGLRPGVLPDFIPGRPYNLPEWEPLWEAAAGLQVPLIFHLTGGRLTTAAHQVAQQGSASFQAKDPISSVVYVSAAMTENVSWMINTGALERYPDLQVVMTEGYAGWLGWLVGFMDEKYLGRYSRQEGMAGRLFGPDDLRTKISAPPSYYLKRQVKATFMYDPAAIQLRNLTGVEALMWGNDYPHIEGVFPDSQAVVEKQFEGVPEDEILAMVHDNAAKLYGLTV